MPDKWEIDHGLNPLQNDSLGDPDGDGVFNKDESAFGLDPNNAETRVGGPSDHHLAFGREPDYVGLENAPVQNLIRDERYDGLIALTWTLNPQWFGSIEIRRQDSNGNWSPLVTLPSGTVDYSYYPAP